MNREKVIVVLARCSASSSDTFGARIEERSPNAWFVNWAFAVPAAVASREGYDQATVTGSFTTDEHEYPGCPHCGRNGLVLCTCDRLGCWDTQNSAYRCPWCGAQGSVEGQITQLTAGGDI